MPEETPASERGTGDRGTGAARPSMEASPGPAHAQLTDRVASALSTLADIVSGLPEAQQLRVVDALVAAIEGLAAAVGHAARSTAAAATRYEAIAPATGAGSAAGPAPYEAAAPTGGVAEAGTTHAGVAAADVPGAGPAVGPAVGTVEVPAPAGATPAHEREPEGEGVDAVANLAARLVADARRRRGLIGDPSRGVLDDPHLQPPPQVSMASVVPFSDDPDRPDRRRGAPPAGDRPEEAEAGGRAGGRAADPVAAALTWAATAGRPVVVGFADVVGVADPGTATRLLQTRVLAALTPGDVAVMVGGGEVAFVLSDADLVEADRRFRHLVAPPTANAPAVRLGFVVPRPAEPPDEVVARARAAATGRWARLRIGRPN